MFTGIIRGIGKITKIQAYPGFSQYSIQIDKSLLSNLEIGASIAIDGTCLTVVQFNDHEVSFDVINETLSRTTLKNLKDGDLVNIERAAKFGDEIGGHFLSGHIFGTALITSIDRNDDNWIISLKCPQEWTKYLFPKGYVALNGASLTLVDVDKTQGTFIVHLIPETLEKTTFGIKKISDAINVEIDSQTQAVVDTIETFFKNRCKD